MSINPDGTKPCCRCNTVKGASNFYKNKKAKDGLASWCKECVLSYHREKYANTHKTVLMIRGGRGNAKKAQLRRAKTVKYGEAVVEALESMNCNFSYQERQDARMEFGRG